MPKRDKGLRALQAIADRETCLYLERTAMTHLEAALGSLLFVYTPEHVADLLERQAQMLRDYG